MKPLLLTSTPEARTSTDPGPRTDFLELARLLDAEISYPLSGGGLVAKVEEKTASDWRQAWSAARRRDVSVFVSLSEKVGLPLALLGPRHIPHVLIAHNLTSSRKRAFQRRFRWLNRFARILVLCRAQERYLLEEVGLAEDRVRFVYDKVDSVFLAPAPALSPAVATGLILSVGRERRDYTTLAAAARLLPEVEFVVVASSPWSRRTGQDTGSSFPPNVTLRRGLPWTELRSLYATACLVVVPLEIGTEYAAGVNGVLEAMSMGRPLIVTATPGIADYIEDGATARMVPAGDPEALASAIRELQNCPERAERLGENARAVVAGGRNLDHYLEEVTHTIREVAL